MICNPFFKTHLTTWIFRPFCCKVWKQSDAIFWGKISPALELFQTWFPMWYHPPQGWKRKCKDFITPQRSTSVLSCFLLLSHCQRFCFLLQKHPSYHPSPNLSNDSWRLPVVSIQVVSIQVNSFEVQIVSRTCLKERRIFTQNVFIVQVQTLLKVI